MNPNTIDMLSFQVEDLQAKIHSIIDIESIIGYRKVRWIVKLTIQGPSATDGSYVVLPAVVDLYLVSYGVGDLQVLTVCFIRQFSSTLKTVQFGNQPVSEIQYEHTI